MKNIDKVIAQAREWAHLACTLAEIDGADLSTLESAHSTLLRATDALWEARARLEDRAPVRWGLDANGRPYRIDVPEYHVPSAERSDGVR